MDILINDFSIDAQYNDLDEFLDSINQSFLPVFNIVNKYKYNIYKAYGTYSRKLFDDVCIYDLVSSSKFRGIPEITRLRSLLNEVTSEPFWEDCTITDKSATYRSDSIGEFEGTSPNCFSEVFERNGVLLSFEHEKFKDTYIEIFKNGDRLSIENAKDNDSFSEHLFSRNKIGFSEYLLSKKYSRKIDFAKSNLVYYADEVYLKGLLSPKDVRAVLKNFKLSLEFIEHGDLKSRFSDSITHKKITYYEFRCTLEGSREFRIFYTLFRDTFIYFNSIIKKESATSTADKDRTIALIKEYFRSH